ncbi:Xylem serine proteinase 1 [Acorus gramineus]|uniref:Xylem serine proteinase 1 n=1 Tax=Acorus gramineus TaxID=55184 RepID=A0AAV9ACF9_ACOGR|nr:Xylem serine proteinase 1 [Acorus gramineus]
MGVKGSHFQSLLLFLFFVSGGLLCIDAHDKHKYIVYLGDKVHDSVDVVGSHHDLLSEILGSNDAAKESIYHSYTKSMNAFAAFLTEEEAEELSELDGVLYVFKCKTRKLHTTRTWDFVGLTDQAKRNLAVESNIVIAVIDSGITPSSPSFNDTGYGPPPSKFRGTCGPFANFTCNNKIIGGQYFRMDKNIPKGEYASPLDFIGHGTHTSSTAAGVNVETNFYGLATGTAHGGVPSARIAMYKVCWGDGTCNDEDTFAAFDAAIYDGVDIINLSLGQSPGHHVTDAIAVGSFHAMRYGILTAASAGNDGPFHRTVVNYAPWLLTVGGSTIDRQFKSDLKLGNGKTYSGFAINPYDMEGVSYPLILGVDAATDSTKNILATRCMQGQLSSMVEGKIVFCTATDGVAPSDETVKAAGGVGAIFQLYTATPQATSSLVLPGTMVSPEDGEAIKDYIQNDASPVAVIHKSYEANVTAPTMFAFSSRGPNPVYKSILKPDLVAPGLDVLAAYPDAQSVTRYPEDDRHAKYIIQSGTSMAAPHATAAAAYVKSFHPTWSPAAIKSALITTAKVMTPGNTITKDDEYAYGAGQIDPVKAVDPGLVYNANQQSYLNFLCAKHPDMDAIRVFAVSKNVDCSKFPAAEGYDALNYPTFQYIVEDVSKPSVAEFQRYVTNVGSGPATYQVTVKAPEGVQVTVSPSTLSFISPYQKQQFKVTVKTSAVTGDVYAVSGSLVWSDGVHSVRSPIVVHYAY